MGATSSLALAVGGRQLSLGERRTFFAAPPSRSNAACSTPAGARRGGGGGGGRLSGRRAGATCEGCCGTSLAHPRKASPHKITSCTDRQVTRQPPGGSAESPPTRARRTRTVAAAFDFSNSCAHTSATNVSPVPLWREIDWHARNQTRTCRCRRARPPGRGTSQSTGAPGPGLP